MATCFSGTGVTPEDDLKTQDVDNASEDESQDKDHIKQLIHKTALLK